MKTLKISTAGVSHDYKHGLLPILIQSLGYHIEWVKPSESDLLIYGPFLKPKTKKFRWLPRATRPLVTSAEDSIRRALGPRKNAPVSIFHTSESIRHDAIPADFSLSFDLAVCDEKHFRFPYWMEMVDWSAEGITCNQNPRFGQLFNIQRLMQPLGREFLTKPQKAAIFTSHLREPRATLFRVLQQYIEVDGFGPHFDHKIKNHHLSNFSKLDILKEYAFNLCPENGLSPGYYTEKIPEAFLAGSLPITWTDTNVQVDFNPHAFINLLPLTAENFEPLQELLHSQVLLNQYAEQALLLKAPSIEPLREFLSRVIQDATS